ncbi:hypothetical protein [Dactylosporangium sp. CA-139066]|uniref:hypothetical protein n=1 Tax=Dactylosporangium sp. CA-139066 TaxID=3239930 RepID=UPI003D8D8EAE
MSDKATVTGRIEIRPRVPNEILRTLREQVGQVVITQPTTGDYTEISDASNDIGHMVYGDRVSTDITTIVAALGDAYTYTGDLECFDDDDPADRWRVRVTDDRHAIEETPLIIYPPDGLVIPREVIEEWAGGPISDGQLIQLGETLPKSPIPDAIAMILAALG